MRTLLAVVLAVGVSCTAADQAPQPSPSPTPPPDQVTGLISELTYEGNQIASFSLETEDGSFEILIDPEHDYGFNLKHLEQHRKEDLPVRVTLEARDDGLYALDILDG